MPTASVARARVTQSAGPRRSERYLERPSASAEFVNTAQVSPTTQLAAPRPAPLRATTPASAASSSNWAIMPISGPA